MDKTYYGVTATRGEAQQKSGLITALKCGANGQHFKSLMELGL